MSAASDDHEDVRFEARGAVRWIVIDRPERRNALNDAVIGAISRGLTSAQEDPAARAIVLTGAGDRAFCAGADLTAAPAPSAMTSRAPTSRWRICSEPRAPAGCLSSRG